MRKFFLPILAIYAFVGHVSAQTTPASTPTPIQLGHGINFGDALDGPSEGAWGVKLQEDYFHVVKTANFQTVRIPIRWTAHISAHPPYIIDPVFFARVDWVVAQAKANRLQAILDYHYDDDLMRDPDAYGDRFVALWKQIAEHYQGEPSSILFELLNEPNGKIDAAHWNALIIRALAVIRPTNSERDVIVGPVQWNSISKLPELVLPPDDRHLIATVHFYDPMKFTHQGASWIDGSKAWLGTTWQGTEAEKQAVTTAFDQAAAWGRDHDRPIFLGEFGAYSTGDMASRHRWISFVVASAERRGFCWAYWEFCAGFGAYDPVANHWRKPILEALIPDAESP